jgi:hypothetical protein
MAASIVYTFESRVGSAARPLGLLGSALANIGKPRNEPRAARLLRARCFYSKSAIVARLYWCRVVPESIMAA